MRWSEPEEFAAKRVLVEPLLVIDLLVQLVLAEMRRLPLVELCDRVLAIGGERLLFANGLHPFVDRRLIGALQFVQFLLKSAEISAIRFPLFIVEYRTAMNKRRHYERPPKAATSRD